MEQEQILSEIKAKVGQTSLSEKTLTDYVSANLPEGEPDESYYAKHVGFLKSLNGNYSHDVARQVTEFKKNYKPQQEEPKVETPPNGDDALQKRLEALEKAYENERKANALNSIRAEVKGKADGLKVSNKAIWEDVVATIVPQEDATVDTLLTSVKTAYEAKLKSYLGNGATPYQGSPTPPKNDGSQLDDFFARKAEQGKMPKKD